MTILSLSQDISLWPCVLLVVCAALPLTGKLRIHPLKPWYSLVICCRLLSLGTVVFGDEGACKLHLQQLKLLFIVISLCLLG